MDTAAHSVAFRHEGFCKNGGSPSHHEFGPRHGEPRILELEVAEHHMIVLDTGFAHIIRYDQMCVYIYNIYIHIRVATRGRLVMHSPLAIRHHKT